MSLSKRLRFEVLKRDGFRCKYCGAGPITAPLEVDHVVPKSKGGPDSAENLVTACWGCNRGKSNIELDDPRLPAPATVDSVKEHAKQIRAFLAAQKKVTEARNDVAEWLADEWRGRVGDDPPRVIFQRFRTLLEIHPIERLLSSMDAVGSRYICGTVEQAKYFHGCLRRKREREEATNA